MCVELCLDFVRPSSENQCCCMGGASIGCVEMDLRLKRGGLRICVFERRVSPGFLKFEGDLACKGEEKTRVCLEQARHTPMIVIESKTTFISGSGWLYGVAWYILVYCFSVHRGCTRDMCHGPIWRGHVRPWWKITAVISVGRVENKESREIPTFFCLLSLRSPHCCVHAKCLFTTAHLRYNGSTHHLPCNILQTLSRTAYWDIHPYKRT